MRTPIDADESMNGIGFRKIPYQILGTPSTVHNRKALAEETRRVCRPIAESGRKDVDSLGRSTVPFLNLCKDYTVHSLYDFELGQNGQSLAKIDQSTTILCAWKVTKLR